MAGDQRDEEMPEAPERLRLVHPIYLDVPMMISFLAALRGGVSFEDESTLRRVSGADREQEGKAGLRASVPGLASLLGFDMSGRMARKAHEEEEEEVRAVRQHTSASLFNALYDYLHKSDSVAVVRRANQLGSIQAGHLVEIDGEFVGNPLARVLAFFSQAVPYLEIEEETQGALENRKKKGKDPRKSGSPQVRAQAEEVLAQQQLAALEEVLEKQQQKYGLRMLKQMQSDLKDAKVHDTVIQGPDGVHVVLTMSSEFFTEATSEYLRAGNFTAIGKVTRVLQEDDEINLARRTVLDAAGSEAVRGLIEAIEQTEDLAIRAGSPIIGAPAVQILPLAVFV